MMMAHCCCGCSFLLCATSVYFVLSLSIVGCIVNLFFSMIHPKINNLRLK